MDYIQDRKLKIQLLERAQRYVRNGEFTFICDALGCSAADLCSGSATEIDHKIYEAATQIQQYIMAAIYPYSSYGHWVMDSNSIPYFRGMNACFVDARLAWINWMIACYEEDIANYKKENHG